MKTIVVFATLIGCASGAHAQTSSISGGGPIGSVPCGASGGSSGGSNGNGTSQIRGTGILAGRFNAIGALTTNLQGDQASCAALRRLSPSYHGFAAGGNTYFTRVFVDRDTHQYFGYEVVLEQRSNGEYSMTFGDPGFSPMEAAIEGTSTGALSIQDWKLRRTTLPEPRIVHEGDNIDIELTLDPSTGLKVADELTIGAYSSSLTRPTGLAAPRIPIVPKVPTVEGTARDFTAGDAEMTLTAPRVTINGTPISQSSGQPGPTPLATAIFPKTTDALVWLYVPGHGRYILSLVPRPGLDFQLAGEVRGGAAKFSVGSDLISLECGNEIAPGHAPYRLYVLFDPLWEPTAQSQKGQFAVGSVGVGELVLLKRQ